MVKRCWQCKRNKARSYGARCKICAETRCVNCGHELKTFTRWLVYDYELKTHNEIKVCDDCQGYGLPNVIWRLEPKKKKLSDIFKSLRQAVKNL